LSEVPDWGIPHPPMSKLELKEPMPGYKALIFDLDGTLVDSMPAHFKAWSLAFEQQGHPDVFPEDVFYAMGGRPTHDIIASLNEKHGLTLDADEVAELKERAYLEQLDLVELIPEVAAIAKAHRGKIPIAVASGGCREVVGMTLQKLNLSDWFDEVVTATDVKNGKPAPDIFLETALRLGVPPESCVVYEDGGAGIISARAAGMEVIVVPTPLHLG
jgi:beta-phosphoglucomutase family hydrolase